MLIILPLGMAGFLRFFSWLRPAAAARSAQMNYQD